MPVIAPRFPTIEPVVRQYNVGVMFDDPSPESIARAVTKVLTTPKSIWRDSLEAAREDLIWETQYPVLEQAILGDGGETSTQPKRAMPPLLKPGCESR